VGIKGRQKLPEINKIPEMERITSWGNAAEEEGKWKIRRANDNKVDGKKKNSGVVGAEGTQKKEKGNQGGLPTL